MTFTELCDHLNIPWRTDHHHSTQGFVNVDCPSCSPGWGAFRLGYNEAGRFMNCWHCGSKWLPMVLREITKRPYNECVELSKGLACDKVVRLLQKRKYKEPGGIRFLSHSQAHSNYLRGRGLDPNELHSKWLVSAIGPDTVYAWRIFVPVTEGGVRVSWTTRAISAANPMRYVSAPADMEAVPIKNCLYGHEFIRGTALVVEGCFDVWKIGPGAVATFGTAVTREQILALSKIPRRFICFDAEPTAQRQARRLCELLSVYPGVTQNVVLDSKDPGSAPESELKSLRKLLE